MSDTSLIEVYWDSRRHGIYLTRMPDVFPTGVLAKFTTKCNKAAHCLFANHDTPLTSTLYHCVCVICGLYIEVLIADGSAGLYGVWLGEFFAHLTGCPAHCSGEPSRRVDELVSVKLHFGPYASDSVLRVARTFMDCIGTPKQVSTRSRRPGLCGRVPQPIHLGLLKGLRT